MVIKMSDNNNQSSKNIKVVIPPRPVRKNPQAHAKTEMQAQVNTVSVQPVRVTIPPRHDRQSVQVTIPSHPVQNKPNNIISAQSSMPNIVNVNNNPVHNDIKTEKSFEQLAQLAASIVMITMYNDKGEPTGTGSGIMIGSKGYILTNNHVAGAGRFYAVKIENDDNTYKTDELIKYNSVFDLAIIRINRILNPLPVYKGGRELVRGQKVVAIGSPMGLFNTVSDGIISAFRKFEDIDMLQFTAPISPGSSGGALINMYGEVIGVITAHMVDAQNINIAVGYKAVNMFAGTFMD